jgi:hypothetical protein
MIEIVLNDRMIRGQLDRPSILELLTTFMFLLLLLIKVLL